MPGYNVATVEPVKGGVVCPHCGLMLRDAVQTGDGYRLCETCFKEICQEPNCTCPRCGISVNPTQFWPDRAVQRDIVETLVRCDFHTHGCPWQGQLKHLEEHSQGCRYQPVQCPNPRCSELLAPDEMDKHIDQECQFRRVQCRYCQLEYLAASMEEHYTNCPVICDRYHIGIERDKPPQFLNFHAYYGEPIVMARSESPAGDPETCLLHETPQDQQAQCAEETAGHDLLETAVKSTQAGKMDKNGGVKLDDLHLKSRQQNDKIIQLEDVVKRLQSQIELQSRAKPQHQSTVGSCESRAFEAGGVTESRLVQLEKKIEDIERQTAMMKVHVSELELQLQASLASTHNGSFLWRIPDIARRKRDAVEERITSIYSPPFYTGRNGYKMCILAYLNGDGIGYKTHFSIFFVLMKGEYDPLLKWPFESKVSLILVDQNHRKHIVQTFKLPSFQRPRSDMNVASGCPQFAKLNVLEDESYNKDDVLYIKCIIDISHIFHP